MSHSESQEVSPEKKLLFLCSRVALDRCNGNRAASVDARVGALDRLLAGPTDWEFLLQASAENSVLPLLALALGAAPQASVPSNWMARLKAGARAAGMRSLQLSAELIRVAGALRAAGVTPLPYKGPVVAIQAYGDLALREFDDLDIIVPQRDMSRANEAMHALGYKPRFPWVFNASAIVPGEYTYQDAERRAMVELHTEQTLRHFPVVPDLAAMSDAAVSIAIGGHEVETFSPEDTLVLLCVHGAKDFWERISWIADVAGFVERQKLDWDRVLRRAEQLKAQRMLYLGLALAARTLDARLPTEIRGRLDGDEIAGRLAVEIESRILRRAAESRSAASSFQYRRQMVAGAIDSWRYGLRLATAPAQDDWQLPRALAPLYVILRPLRLLRKFGADRNNS